MHRFSIPTVATASPYVPNRFERLPEMARNLWWTQDEIARNGFRRLAEIAGLPTLAPVLLLRRMPIEAWTRAEKDTKLIELYRGMLDRFHEEVSKPIEGCDEDPTVAYFSTEYGWHESFPIYSGGLGVLSGDHTKAASDLGLPLIGVGLFYGHGYFRQTVDIDGNQQHAYPALEADVLPVARVADKNGEPLFLSLEFPGREVIFGAWVAWVGRVPVLLLDTDIPQNSPGNRRITHLLYVQGREMRFCQEWLLGVGGVRLLRALGIDPDVWHLNEGHSAMLSLERISERMQEQNEPFDTARSRIAGNALFTTHTPVPAGNESFDSATAQPYLDLWAERCGAESDQARALGRVPGDGDRFNLTALALRTAAKSNGVSQLHGEVADRMWTDLLPVEGAVQNIESVTNGVHLPTWRGQSIARVCPVPGPSHDATFGPKPALQESLTDEALWQAHREQKERLWDDVLERLREQWGRHGAPPEHLDALEDKLGGDALTIGFARRFATYKRGDLLTRDVERLARLLGNKERPVRVLFAGKAHPADRPGQAMIRRICELSRNEAFHGKLWFLEGYDMRLGRRLVQGCDLWLNTPKRPMEASGTSGMKAAVNGALNLSIFDGWWCEGYDASHGWTIGPAKADAPASDDARDHEDLFRLLEEEIVPTYYDREEGGLPHAWIARMKGAMNSLSPRFSARRMVGDYRDRFYRPLADHPAIVT